MKKGHSLFALLLNVVFLDSTAVAQETQETDIEQLMSKPVVTDVAKGCPGIVRDFVKDRHRVFTLGSFGKLMRYYDPDAVINVSLAVHGQAAKRETMDLSGRLTDLQWARRLANQYEHVQLDGKCDIHDNYVRYTGKEVEKFMITGRRSYYLLTTYTLRVERAGYRIVEDDEDTTKYPIARD